MSELHYILPRYLTRAVTKTDTVTLTVTDFNVTMDISAAKVATLPESQVAVGNLYSIVADGESVTVSTLNAALTPKNLLTDVTLNYGGERISLVDTEVALLLSMGDYWIVLIKTEAAP